MTDLLIWPPLLGVLGMVVAVIIYMIVRSYDPGSEALQKIADAIHEGAMVFMKRIYAASNFRGGTLGRYLLFAWVVYRHSFPRGRTVFSLRGLVWYVHCYPGQCQND